MRTYNKINSPSKGVRISDRSFSVPGGFSNESSAAQTLSLFRTKSIGDYTSHVDQTTGNIVYDTKEVVTPTLSEGLTLKVSDAQNQDINIGVGGAVDVNNATLKSALADPTKDRLVFGVDGTTNYAKSENGAIVDSNVQFRAKDMFYGFVRQLYSSIQLRENGKFNEVSYANIPALSAESIAALRAQFANDSDYIA